MKYIIKCSPQELEKEGYWYLSFMEYIDTPTIKKLLKSKGDDIILYIKNNIIVNIHLKVQTIGFEPKGEYRNNGAYYEYSPEEKSMIDDGEILICGNEPGVYKKNTHGVMQNFSVQAYYLVHRNMVKTIKRSYDHELHEIKRVYLKDGHSLPLLD